MGIYKKKKEESNKKRLVRLMCMTFCGDVETVHHFNCQSIYDLWILDASIPLKDKLLLEMIRGAVLWVIWLEK